MRLVIFIVFLLFIKSCNNIKVPPIDKNQTIEQVVYDILKLSKEDNIIELNQKYVNNTIGFYEKRRIGAMDYFFHNKNIGREISAVGTVYQIMTSINDKDVREKLIYCDNLKYDCNSFEWNKSGLIISKIHDIRDFHVSLIKGNYAKVDLENIKLIKKNSYMVVLTDKDIVFYLTKLKGQYYMTFLDRTITDCGA